MRQQFLRTENTNFLEEGFNNVTGEQLNVLLLNSYLAEVAESDKDLAYNVGVIIRDTYDNNVMTIGEVHEPLMSDYVKEDPRDLQGYFLLMSSVQAILKMWVEIPLDVIPKTVLQAVGVIKTDTEICVVFHLIIPDDCKDAIKNDYVQFEKIEEVINFTNLSAWTKIILPTLKIVGGNNIENNSNREQGM